jgi:hypothetical protein
MASIGTCRRRGVELKFGPISFTYFIFQLAFDWEAPFSGMQPCWGFYVQEDYHG